MTSILVLSREELRELLTLEVVAPAIEKPHHHHSNRGGGSAVAGSLAVRLANQRGVGRRIAV